MPSKSRKQHNLMAMVANNPKAAKRLGIPQSVGEEFMKADKGKKKYMDGGLATAAMRSGRTMPAMPVTGAPTTPAMPVTGAPVSPAATGLANAAMRSGRTMPVPGRPFKKGGSVTRGDGMCTKGHTKGRMV